MKCHNLKIAAVFAFRVRSNCFFFREKKHIATKSIQLFFRFLSSKYLFVCWSIELTRGEGQFIFRIMMFSSCVLYDQFTFSAFSADGEACWGFGDFRGCFEGEGPGLAPLAMETAAPPAGEVGEACLVFGEFWFWSGNSAALETGPADLRSEDLGGGWW